MYSSKKRSHSCMHMYIHMYNYLLRKASYWLSVRLSVASKFTTRRMKGFKQIQKPSHHSHKAIWFYKSSATTKTAIPTKTWVGWSTCNPTNKFNFFVRLIFSLLKNSTREIFFRTSWPQHSALKRRWRKTRIFSKNYDIFCFEILN